MASSSSAGSPSKKNVPKTIRDFNRLAAAHLDDLVEIEKLEKDLETIRARVGRRRRNHPYLSDMEGISRREAKKADPSAFVPPPPKKEGAKAPPPPKTAEAKQKAAEKKVRRKETIVGWRTTDEGERVAEKMEVERDL